MTLKALAKRSIPARYHYALANIKNRLWGGYTRQHYSQFGEDILLATLLPKKKGIYVDVGAHHPERYSNTKIFFDRGWRGVNIDPNPDTIALFNKARPKDRNLCVGIALRDAELTYYTFSDPAVNTFQESEAKRWMYKDWITFMGTATVQVRPLGALLQESIVTEPIDLLSVDAEGMDMEVLQSNDWQTYIPKVIVIESATFNPINPTSDPVVSFLLKKGYLLHAYMGTSLIFDSKHA